MTALLPARTSGAEMTGAWRINSVNCVDALTLLAGLPDNSVDLVVTSPPYDNLRDYSLDKMVIWRYNITHEEKQRVINELKKLGIKPITSP